MGVEKHGAYTGPWYDDRNERRKEAYHSDAEYRDKANRSAREGYRTAKGRAAPFDPRTNLKKIAGFGKARTLQSPLTTELVLTFSKAELAAVLGRPTKQVQQWTVDGRLPPPIIKGKVEGRERNWLDVYTLAEATAIVTSLGPFLADLIYYRCDHVDAVNAVHQAVEGAR